MVFGRGPSRASRVGAAVLRHGRRVVLAGGFLMAAWAAGAGAAGAEETEGRGSLAETLPVADAAEVTAQTEQTLERTAQGATGLVTDAVAPATQAAPGVQEALDPVVGEVDSVTGAARELPVTEPASDSLGAVRPEEETPRTADGPAHGDDIPAEWTPEVDSPRAPAEDDGGATPEHQVLNTAGDNSAPPTAADPSPASDTASEGEWGALSGSFGSAVTGSGSSAGPAFADHARAPGLPADVAEAVVRTMRGIAATHAEAEEPSVSPD